MDEVSQRDINTDKRQEEQTLMNFFENLQEILKEKIPIVALRPKLAPTLEANFEGDFDFLIQEENFGFVLKKIYNICKEKGINFVLIQTKKNKKLFRFFVKDKEYYLTVEFWTAIEHTLNGKPQKFLSKEIFDAIIRTNSENDILPLIYVTHLYHKNKDLFTEENIYRRKVFLEKLDKGDGDSQEEVVQILKNIENGLDIEKANDKALHLLANFDIKSYAESSLQRKIRSGRNKVFDVKNIVPISGPDGAGKGSVAQKSLDDLKQHNLISFRFKKLFRLPKLYKLRLILIPDYQKSPKNKLDEKISYYIFFTALLGFWILSIRKKNKSVLLDRFFTDYLGTPIRYLENGKKTPQRLKLYKILRKLTPRPKNMVFLSCKNASLIERKNELSATSVEFLEDIYRDFIEKKQIQRVLFISTENDISCSSSVLKAFLKEVVQP